MLGRGEGATRKAGVIPLGRALRLVPTRVLARPDRSGINRSVRRWRREDPSSVPSDDSVSKTTRTGRRKREMCRFASGIPAGIRPHGGFLNLRPRWDRGQAVRGRDRRRPGVHLLQALGEGQGRVSCKSPASPRQGFLLAIMSDMGGRATRFPRAPRVPRTCPSPGNPRRPPARCR